MNLSAEFEMTAEDYRQFLLFHYAKSPAAKRLYQWALVIGTLACLGPFLLVWYSNDDLPFLEVLAEGWYFLLGVPFFWLFYFVVNRYAMDWTIKNMIREGKNRGILGLLRVELTSAGVVSSSQYIETKTAWPAIERIAESDEYLIIYQSSLSAVVVPRRAFANPLRYDEFAAAARTFYEKNRIGD